MTSKPGDPSSSAGASPGASAAFHLASHGRRVVLLERGDDRIRRVGSEHGRHRLVWLGRRARPSGASHGGKHRASSRPCRRTSARTSSSAARAAIQAIRTAEEYEWERERVETLAQARTGGGAPDDARGAAHRARLLAALLGALYSPRRGQADPVKATQAFARLAERRGARVLTHHEVTAVAPRAAGGYAVPTSGGEVVAGALVIAAGAWCGPLGAMLGLDIPIVPVRGQMWATAPLPPRSFHTISAAESAMAWCARSRRRAAGSHASRRPARDATSLRPPAAQRRDHLRRRSGAARLRTDSHTPDPKGIEVNRDQAISVLPFLAELPIARTWAGPHAVPARRQAAHRAHPGPRRTSGS